MSAKLSRIAFLSIVFMSLAISPSVLAQERPEVISIEHENLFPEGIAYDTEGERFLLSSSKGAVYEVTDDSTATEFIEDTDLVDPGGLEIDYVHNRLLLTNGDISAFFPQTDPAGPQQAALCAYDLTTGERLFMADLSELQIIPNQDGITGTLPNDVAVDADGNAYVTNTISPVIYKVAVDGEVTIFVEDESLAWLNGIVAHPDGYLIIGSSPNHLFKIPLDEPEIIPIELTDEIKFDVTDGMILLPEDELVMVTFPGSIIYRLRSDDDWASAILTGISTGHDQGWATTVALRDEDVYTIYSHLNAQMSGENRDTFEIVRVEFEEK